jgi:hypothetical protein
MKFTKTRPILEMTRAEAEAIYNFLEILQDEGEEDSVWDFMNQYEENSDLNCECYLNYILKIKD